MKIGKNFLCSVTSSKCLCWQCSSSWLEKTPTLKSKTYKRKKLKNGMQFPHLSYIQGDTIPGSIIFNIKINYTPYNVPVQCYYHNDQISNIRPYTVILSGLYKTMGMVRKNLILLFVERYRMNELFRSNSSWWRS